MSDIVQRVLRVWWSDPSCSCRGRDLLSIYIHSRLSFFYNATRIDLSSCVIDTRAGERRASVETDRGGRRADSGGTQCPTSSSECYECGLSIYIHSRLSFFYNATRIDLSSCVIDTRAKARPAGWRRDEKEQLGSDPPPAGRPCFRASVDHAT
jgi:hypothetical protein